MNPNARILEMCYAKITLHTLLHLYMQYLEVVCNAGAIVINMQTSDEQASAGVQQIYSRPVY